MCTVTTRAQQDATLASLWVSSYNVSINSFQNVQCTESMCLPLWCLIHFYHSGLKAKWIEWQILNNADRGVMVHRHHGFVHSFGFKIMVQKVFVQQENK